MPHWKYTLKLALPTNASPEIYTTATLLTNAKLEIYNKAPGYTVN